MKIKFQKSLCSSTPKLEKLLMCRGEIVTMEQTFIYGIKMAVVHKSSVITIPQRQLFMSNAIRLLISVDLTATTVQISNFGQGMDQVLSSLSLQLMELLKVLAVLESQLIFLDTGGIMGQTYTVGAYMVNIIRNGREFMSPALFYRLVHHHLQLSCHQLHLPMLQVHLHPSNRPACHQHSPQQHP